LNTTVEWFDWAPGQPNDYHRQQCLSYVRYDYFGVRTFIFDVFLNNSFYVEMSLIQSQLIQFLIFYRATPTNGMIWIAKPMLLTTFARSYATKHLEWFLRELYDFDGCTMDVASINARFNVLAVK